MSKTLITSEHIPCPICFIITYTESRFHSCCNKMCPVSLYIQDRVILFRDREAIEGIYAEIL